MYHSNAFSLFGNSPTTATEGSSPSIINLFGLISKSPSQLSKSLNPVGEKNDLIISKVLGFWRKNINCDLWLGWGDKGKLYKRDLEVLKLIKSL